MRKQGLVIPRYWVEGPWLTGQKLPRG